MKIRKAAIELHTLSKMATDVYHKRSHFQANVTFIATAMFADELINQAPSVADRVDTIRELMNQELVSQLEDQMYGDVRQKLEDLKIEVLQKRLPYADHSTLVESIQTIIDSLKIELIEEEEQDDETVD
jgi:predicted lipid-binding transport protein (Tim44 family)